MLVYWYMSRSEKLLVCNSCRLVNYWCFLLGGKKRDFLINQETTLVLSCLDSKRWQLALAKLRIKLNSKQLYYYLVITISFFSQICI
jgi:hypothetical protein